MKEFETEKYKQNIDEVNVFINTLAKEKKLSEHTINAYLKDLELFFQSIENKTFSEISEEDLLIYIEKMREEYTQNTVYRKILSLKVFYKYLLNHKKIDKLITENIKNNKQQKQIPEILSEEEIYYIIENCDIDEKGKRDLVIIKILYETGMLISDLLKLTIEDLNEYKYISYGSSKKSHVVRIGNELAEILENYITNVWLENFKNNEKLLFPELSRQNFAARLKKYAAKAGITRSIYPNMFRNTLAVNLLDNGKNIRDIKDRLNYVNISRTGIYNIRNKNDIKEIYDKIAIGDWNVPEDFDKLDDSYDEIKNLLRNKKLVDAYTVLKSREEVEAKYLFVLVNILLKKYKKASELLENLTPETLVIVDLDLFYETKGLCYFEQNNYLEATKNFLKALEINSENFYSKYNLTMIYLLKKDSENAEKGLVELLEVEPNNDVLKENLKLLRESK